VTVLFHYIVSIENIFLRSNEQSISEGKKISQIFRGTKIVVSINKEILYKSVCILTEFCQLMVFFLSE
jgi:hypothetical protein